MQSLGLTEVGGGYLFLSTAVGIAIGAVLAGQLSKGKVEPGLSCISGYFITIFFFCLYFFWIGWRLLFSKTLNDIKLKSAAIYFIVVSFCILMSLIEDRFPMVGNALKTVFYPTLSKSKTQFKK